MEARHHQIISYLRECYRADNREVEILNPFDRKIDCKLFVEKKDVLLHFKRSAEGRFVINELKKLEQQSDISTPLKILLEEKNQTAAPTSPNPGSNPQTNDIPQPPIHEHIPAILSSPQKQIIANASTDNLNLVIGPPGTGKSVTIAAVALDHMVRGQSVLIASKTNQAVDVVADKIESILGVKNVVFRGGRQMVLKQLKEFLQNLLKGILPFPAMSAEVFKTKEKLQKELNEKIQQLEITLTLRSEMELRGGDCKTRDRKNLLAKLGTQMNAFLSDIRLNRLKPYWEEVQDYHDSIERYLSLTRELLQYRIRENIQKVVNETRGQLKQLLKAVSSVKSSRQETFFAKIDFREVFKAFPLWLVNQSDIGRVLPLEREMFDIALIDEATQCDTASSFPILQRARRAVVFGDPHQLRHISFLSRNRQHDFAKKAGITQEYHERFNYRDSGILDAVQKGLKKQSQVVFLDEHFRGLPPLIRFSNRTFYGDSLKIMQERPRQHEEPCLFHIVVDGIRNASGVNENEAHAILSKIRHIAAGQIGRPADQSNSIGVLSPFSAQCQYITKILAAELSPQDIQRYSIMVGTPDSFQGEERDIMLLSLCLDKNAHPSAFHYLNRKDTFNVAITRARNLQVIYGSFQIDDPKVTGILRDYLNFIHHQDERMERNFDPLQDVFMEEVQAELTGLDWYCWPNHPVAGFHVDLVVEKDGVIMGIDLIGYPGDYCISFQLERYRIFNPAGLPIFPLPYHDWIKDRQACLQALQEWLRKHS